MTADAPEYIPRWAPEEREMARAIRLASIRGADGQRIRLELRACYAWGELEAYRWFDRATGVDCEVSAPTVAEAIIAAEQGWSGDDWDLRFGR